MNSITKGKHIRKQSLLGDLSTAQRLLILHADRGLLGRVAVKASAHPSYVSKTFHGWKPAEETTKSKRVRKLLEREICKIMRANPEMCETCPLRPVCDRVAKKPE